MFYDENEEYDDGYDTGFSAGYASGMKDGLGSPRGNNDNRKKFSTGLVHYACMCCGKIVEEDSAIIINKRLTVGEAKKIDELNGKVVGYSDKLCGTCQGAMDKGAIMLINYDETKTKDKENPYRTGKLIGISESFFKRIFTTEVPEGRIAYVDCVTWDMVGFDGMIKQNTLLGKLEEELALQEKLLLEESIDSDENRKKDLEDTIKLLSGEGETEVYIDGGLYHQCLTDITVLYKEYDI